MQTPISLLLGVFMAGQQRYRAVLAVFFFIPLLLSAAAIAVTFKALLDPNFGLGPGLHSQLLTQDWLGEPGLAMGVVIFIVSWQFIPFHSLIYQGAVRQIPESLYEAAALDGAGRIRQFFSITLPQLKYTIITSSTLMVVGSLTFFDLIFVLTAGGPGDCHPGARAGHVQTRVPGQPDGPGQRDRRDPRPRRPRPRPRCCAGSAAGRRREPAGGGLRWDHAARRARSRADGGRGHATRTGTAPSASRPQLAGRPGGWFWLAVVLVPLYWIVITSFKRPERLLRSTNPFAPPVNPTLDNYRLVLENDFVRYFVNSVIVTVGTIVPTVAVSFMAAYAIVRGSSTNRFLRGSNGLFLMGLAIPLQAAIIPVYLVIIKLGLYDSLAAMRSSVDRLRHPAGGAGADQLHARRAPRPLRVDAARRRQRVDHALAARLPADPAGHGDGVDLHRAARCGTASCCRWS